MHRFLLLFSELFPAFFCALPIGMGVGGAGLYVLFLTTFGHLPQVEAQGKNLLFFLAAAASGVLSHLHRRLVNRPLFLMLSLFGILGALPGALLAFALPKGLLRIAFALFSILLGLNGWISAHRK